jgi:hypothetical protein
LIDATSQEVLNADKVGRKTRRFFRPTFFCPESLVKPVRIIGQLVHLVRRRASSEAFEGGLSTAIRLMTPSYNDHDAAKEAIRMATYWAYGFLSNCTT